MSDYDRRLRRAAFWAEFWEWAFPTLGFVFGIWLLVELLRY